MINLGQKIRDKVTGLEGIAVARCEYLNGCIQYCIRPKLDKDGKFPEGQYIDEQTLEIVDDGLGEVRARVTGGPQRDTPNSSYRG